jgi:ABC-type uncharacterized transport system substrate-binding protein
MSDVHPQQFNFIREGGNVGRDVSNVHPQQFNISREDGNSGITFTFNFKHSEQFNMIVLLGIIPLFTHIIHIFYLPCI